jgi:predicted nucleic acid-binding protein
LFAPLLFEYEITAILRRAVVTGWISNDLAITAVRKVLALGIHCLPPSAGLHEQALRWADRLGHSKTYDVHYLALAEQLQAELWTADRRLVNGARQAGVTWVHWVGDSD